MGPFSRRLKQSWFNNKTPTLALIPSVTSPCLKLIFSIEIDYKIEDQNTHALVNEDEFFYQNQDQIAYLN